MDQTIQVKSSQAIVRRIVEQHSDTKGAFLTTPLFWDCNCDDAYIHPRTHKVCGICGETRAESPDARVREIITYSIKWNLDTPLIRKLKSALWVCEHCGVPLPRAGAFWSGRYERWFNSTCPASGYYCDSCIATM
jgi:hypothetical protein